MTPNDEYPSALSPEFVANINEPISLYAGEATLIADERHAGTCQVRYSWFPHDGPEVVFSCGLAQLKEPYSLEIPALRLSAKVMPRRIDFGDHGSKLVGLLTDGTTIGDGAALSRIGFHVPNFPFVHGAPVQRGGLCMRARMQFEDEPWTIVVDPVPDAHAPSAPDLSGRLNETRGFAITHSGCLARSDGAPFNAADAHALLEQLGQTLSLARAAFAMPVLRTGYDAAGAIVWRDWTAYATSAWRVHENWFSHLHPEILQSAFTGWRRLSNQDREMLGAALHLYVDSHTPRLATESKLVLAQAALEGLAEGWPYPPLPGAPALAGFQPGSAAERVAAISIALGIPLGVPVELKELAALASPAPNAPALAKVTWVRNQIVHLGNFARLAAHSARLRYEARQFATWHLELAMLKRVGADGKYLNRLRPRTHGDVENLPWRRT